MLNLEKLLDNVPNQVGTLIKAMLGTDNIYIRGNYRSRLAAVRDSIDSAIREYDKEVASSQIKKKKA
jgi:hypothetical protein